jgi:hypothetical protein
MKLYVVKDKDGKSVKWSGTQADAAHDKKALGAKSWEPVEVPTSKPELLAFLNKTLA